MKTQVQRLRSKIEQKKGQRDLHRRQQERVQREVISLRRDRKQHEQAREIIREAGLATQKQLQYHIGDITSLALESVLVDPYALVVDFVERRNKTECDLFFSRNGLEIDPITGSGGGAVDVASFALRVASFTMQRQRMRHLMLFDEPFRWLSRDYQDKAAMMMKELSDKLGIQFILITHEDVIAGYADKTYRVSQKAGISDVK